MVSKAIVKSTPTSYLLGRQYWHFKSIETECGPLTNSSNNNTEKNELSPKAFGTKGGKESFREIK